MLDEVLAAHDRLTLYVGAAAPVAVTDSVIAACWALVVKVRVAVAAPVVCGVKVTVNAALWPAGIVTGNESPPRLNEELFMVAAVTVTLAPLAERLPDADPLVPTITLPTARAVGETASCPAAATPVPDNGTVRVGLGAFDVIVMLPVSLAADVGLNVTVKLTL